MWKNVSNLKSNPTPPNVSICSSNPTKISVSSLNRNPAEFNVPSIISNPDEASAILNGILSLTLAVVALVILLNMD